MKQFWTLCMNGALVAVLGLIDSAFGNNMGVDAIIVIASWGILYYLFHKIAQFGDCCYQCDPSRFTLAFIINAIASVVTGLLMASLSVFMAGLFDISNVQRELLIKCTVIYGLGLPFARTESIFNKYLILTGQGKKLIGATVVFYVMMITCDAACFVLHVPCYWLIVGTVVSDIVTILYYLLVCKCYEGFVKPDWHGVKDFLSKGFFMWLERMGNAVAYFAGSVIASYLGETEYAIHSVCVGIAGSTEDITNCWCQNQIVQLQNVKPADKYAVFKREMRCSFLPCVIMSFVLAFGLFIPMKGELPFGITFKFLCLYLSQIIFLCPYENYRGFVTSLGYTKCMPLNMLIGTAIRLVWAVICVSTPLGLYGFAFMISGCFAIRGLMYHIAVKHKFRNVFEISCL